MRVTRHPPDKHIQYDYTLHQQRLEQVQSAKYLGLTISISQMTWIGVNTFQKFQLRQLRQWVFFGAIWPLQLGTLKKLHTKHKLEYEAPIWHPYHESQIGQVEKVQRTAARWTWRRWRNTSSVGGMLDELEWPSLESRREQSYLTFFYPWSKRGLLNKFWIHSGTVYLDKDKHLTPAPNLRRTRASHESQYTR